ncbi:MAG TPA: oligosaccharide flippase family protein [Gammaproteobacteria bacterium]
MYVDKLIKGSFIYGLGGALNRFIQLLLLPVFTAYLSPGDFGVIAMLALVTMFIVPVFSFGLGTSVGVCYFNAEQSQDKKIIIFNALIILAISSLFLIIVSYLCKDEISVLLFGDSKYADYITLSVLTAAIMVVVQPFQLRLQFEQKAKIFALISFATVLATTTFGIFFIVILDRSVAGYLEASLIGQFTSLVMFASVTLSNNVLRFSKKTIQKLLNHGIPMIPSFLFLFIMQNGVRYPLEWFHGLDAVGVFTVGASFGLVLGVFTNAFISAWTPFALSYSNKQVEASNLLGRVTYYYMVIFGFCVVLFFLFAKPAVMLFTTAQFHDAYQVVGFVAASQYLNALFLMLLPPIYFSEDVKVVTRIQFLSTLLTIAMFTLLIPKAGIIGAAFSVFFASMFMVVIQYLWVRKEKYLRINYELKKMLKLLSIIVCLSSASFLFADSSLITACIVAVLGSIVSGMVMYFLLGFNYNSVRKLLLEGFAGK